MSLEIYHIYSEYTFIQYHELGVKELFWGQLFHKLPPSKCFLVTSPAEWLVDPLVHLDHLLMSTRIGTVLSGQPGVDELVQTAKLHWTLRVYGFGEVV